MTKQQKPASPTVRSGTRKERKQLARQLWSDNPGLDIVHKDGSGIDVGGSEHYAAIAPNRNPQPVRRFGCFTADLREMADWLIQNGVKSVVLQSTGVYWIPVYDVLEQSGLEVWLVNARETRNLPGRKSDVQESQWLLKLHTYGLLRRSFRPTPEVRAIRAVWRERGEYVQQAGVCIQRMQKALTEMNIQLSTVLSDLNGVTGMKILRAIVAGERDGNRLAEFRDKGVRASKETIAKSLEGTWLPEQLAILGRQLGDLDHVHAQMAACDRDLEAMLKQMPSAERTAEPAPEAPALPGQKKKRKGTRKKPSANHPNFNLEKELTRMAGVNLTRIDGVYTMTVQTVISEAGLDMSKWETEHHFVSWIGLAPRNEISGGKVLKRRTRKVKSRLATALRMAATTLLRSDSYLGAQYRRLRGRLGPPKAITAMAAKLARLIYRMLKFGEEFVDKGQAYYEEAHSQRKFRALAKQAAQQGYQLVPV